MTEFKTKRDPLLPHVPTKEEWQKFDRIEQWRRNNHVVMRQLHSDVYADLNTLSNETANLADSIHDAVTVSDTASVNMTLSGQQISAVANIGSHVTIFPWEMSAVNGTWDVQINANQYFNGFWYNTSNTNNDTISIANLFLNSGSFRWTILTRTGPERGILQLLIDGVGASIVDLYSGSYVYNVALSNVASITIGVRSIGLKVYGRNGASNGYITPFSYLNLQRYA